MRSINQSYRIYAFMVFFWKTCVGIKLTWSIPCGHKVLAKNDSIVELMMQKDGSLIFGFSYSYCLCRLAWNNKIANDYDRYHCVWVLGWAELSFEFIWQQKCLKEQWTFYAHIYNYILHILCQKNILVSWCGTSLTDTNCFQSQSAFTKMAV